MTGQQLKNSILQLAIQGKLVPQDPNDEPASVLLQRIRKEKEQLVKEGKLKKKDLISEPITEDEKPFDIPESWEWCRLGEIMHPLKYGTASKSSSQGEMIVLRMGNIQNGEINYDKLVFSNNKEDNVKYLLRPYDLLFNRTNSAELVGKTAIYRGEHPAIYAGYLILLRPVFIEISEFINYVLAAKYTRNYCMDVKTIGVQQCNINAEKIAYHVLPLPPLSEQQRIVAKIEELMPLVEEYDKAQKELNDLNEKLPEQLKKSILQQAIMGKLVPQDPADEPASVLLQRIRKEKEQLVKEGKLKKKDLETTPIADDEKPFDIPESWEWCRLGEICTKIVDGDHNPPAGQDCKTPYLMLSSQNINFDSLVNLDNVRYLTENVFLKEDFRTEARIGDILFTSVGTLGRSCVLNVSLNLCFQRSVTVLRTNIFNQYLKRILDSPYIQDFVAANATGTAQRGFYINQMTKLVIPVPPLSEQHRIVAMVEELFALLEKK